MKVKVCNLCRSFGRKKAANNVSFELESGKIYGFVGPNGSGKTTTLRIMAGIDRPDSGDVLFDDLSVVMYPDRARKDIGYMPDSLPDFRDLRVWEYLDFFARSFGQKGEERRTLLADVEGFTGCDGFRDQFLNTLSKGMKQRVSLARALIHHPKVLLLDEPAAGLDPKARFELRNILKRLAGQGMTIFLSSHILSELQDMCDGAVIIKDGFVVASGLLNELKERMDQGVADGEHLQSAAPLTEDISGDAAQIPKEVSRVAVLIKTLGGTDELMTVLSTMDSCDGAEQTGPDEVRARFQGDDTAIPRVLSGLLAAGVPVVGVQKLEVGLEEMFLKFTM